MRPKISGLETPRDYLDKARRELDRFRSTNDPTHQRDHATNFAITVDALVEWTWEHVLRTHPKWQQFACRNGSPGREFYEAIARMEPALMDMATHSRAAKHSTIDRPPYPTFQASTITASNLITFPKQIATPFVSGAEVPDVTEQAVETRMLYVSYMIRRDGVVEAWEPLAAAALQFWEKFDPDRNP